MKKFICLFLCLISLGFAFKFTNVKVAKADEILNVTSRSAYLIDYNSGTEIYKKNENQRLTIASMTKLMLLNLCFEKMQNGVYDLSTKVQVSKTASGMGGSQVFLEANTEYQAEDLIKSIIIASANDASVAMAEFLYGSEQNCVDEMNLKAKEWGMENTLFSNCTGLPKATQYSCAKDVAKMLYNLIQYKEYFNYSKTWIDEIKHPKDRVTGLTNTNKMVKFYDGCDGGKTGFTQESGFCLSCTAKRGNMRLISVIINSDNSKTRFKETANMFNYAFSNYCNKMVVDSKTPLDLTIKVQNGKVKNLVTIPKKDIFIFSKRNVKEDITIDYKPCERVKAPVKIGDVVGEIIVYKNGVEFDKTEIISNENILEKTYFDYIKDIAKQWN